MRRGVTLLEVLISILVASVGLLGAIAVFPLALSNARKGQIADISAVAGESAIASFKVQGMHEQSRWMMWDNVTQQTVQVPASFRDSSSRIFGTALCIDPMLYAHNRADDPANGDVWSYFPAVPSSASPVRMLRLTLRNGPGEMSQMMADKAFRIEDELMYDRPADESLPAAQLFTGMKNSSGADVPGRRQEQGRLTWFATLVPKIDVLHYLTSARPFSLGDEYVLSIVICRDRAGGEALHVNDPANPEHPWNEWTARIRSGDFHSGGIGGGEVTITTSTSPLFNQEEYVDLRQGQWVMLGRTLPAATGGIQFFQWYRVSSASETVQGGGSWSQDVTLIGADWPTDMMPRQIIGGEVKLGDGVSEECTVSIMPSVVHVYERTIQLSQ